MIHKQQPSVKKGVWLDKNKNLAILNGVAMKEIKQDEELFWYGNTVTDYADSNKTVINREIMKAKDVIKDKCAFCGKAFNSEYHLSDECVK